MYGLYTINHTVNNKFDTVETISFLVISVSPELVQYEA